MIKVLLISLGILIAGLSQVRADQFKVLIIASYHEEFAWTMQCHQGIQSSLSDSSKLNWYYMDTKRRPETEFQEQADAAWDYLEELQPDLVMTGDDNALRLLAPNLVSVEIPVVFFGINKNPREYFESGHLPHHITGVLERPPLMQTVRHLPKLIPDTKRILILNDNSVTAKAQIDTLLNNRNKLYAQGALVESKILSDWEEWKEAIIRSQSEFDIFLPSTYFNIKTRAGEYISPEKAITWIATNSKIPVFVNQDYSVGPNGAMGAYVIKGVLHGKLAGNMALEILQGKAPKSVRPKTDEEGVFYFNQRQLDRFNIKLPPGIRNNAFFK